MSDLSDVIDKTEDEEEIKSFMNEEFLAEQDKKFEELRLKLQSLKEENKRQMDIIINSLDDMMAEKSFIDETLSNLPPMGNEHIENNVPIIGNHFKVVDYLAKITGCKDLDDIVSSIENEKQENDTEDSKEHKDSKMEVTDDTKTSDDCDAKSEVPKEEIEVVESEVKGKCGKEKVESEVKEECGEEKVETVQDSEKSSKKTED